MQMSETVGELMFTSLSDGYRLLGHGRLIAVIYRVRCREVTPQNTWSDRLEITEAVLQLFVTCAGKRRGAELLDTCFDGLSLVRRQPRERSNAPWKDVMVDVKALLEADWEELLEEMIARVELEPSSYAADNCLMGLEWLRDTILDKEEQRRSNMARTILSVNAGSSSLKITLFRVE